MMHHAKEVKGRGLINPASHRHRLTLRAGPHAQRGTVLISRPPAAGGQTPEAPFAAVWAAAVWAASDEGVAGSVGLLFAGLDEVLSAPYAFIEANLDAGDDRKRAPGDAVP